MPFLNPPGQMLRFVEDVITITRPLIASDIFELSSLPTEKVTVHWTGGETSPIPEPPPPSPTSVSDTWDIGALLTESVTFYPSIGIEDTWVLVASLNESVAYTYQPVSEHDTGTLTLTETVSQSVS